MFSVPMRVSSHAFTWPNTLCFRLFISGALLGRLWGHNRRQEGGIQDARYQMPDARCRMQDL